LSDNCIPCCSVCALQHLQWEGVSCDVTLTGGFPAFPTAGPYFPD